MQRDAYIAAILARCTSLQEGGFWPPEPTLRPRAWLHNFPDQHRLAAAVLLDQFIYYADHLTDRLLRAAVAETLQFLSGRDISISTTLDAVKRYLQAAAISPVEGEAPSPADSGNLICRRIRNLFELPDAAIVAPAQAVERALSGSSVILTDDFLGSGEQLVRHWRRSYPTNGRQLSLEQAYAVRPFQATYLCLAATTYGLDRIRREGLPLRVCFAHELGAEYDIRNLANPNLLRWFPDVRRDVSALLDDWAPRLQLDPYMRQDDFDRYGFHSLGLTVGFEHSPCPDATLPIYWAPSGTPDYVPLVVRRP